MALGGQVVELVRLHRLNHAQHVGGVGHVAVMEDEAAILLVGILVEMIDTVGIEAGRPALDAVHLVSLVQQELGQVGAVLSGDAGNQGALCHRNASPSARQYITRRDGKAATRAGSMPGSLLKNSARIVRLRGIG